MSKEKKLVNNPPDVEGWETGGWGDYMRIKNSKLQKQFDDDKALRSRSLSEIFKGVVIFVNGYTNPSSDKLKAIMAEHGGGFRHYYSLSACTHIIATNLPNSKILDIRGKLVVHPNWIIESVAAGKRLGVNDYLLYGKDTSNQKTIGFTVKPIAYPSTSAAVEESSDKIHDRNTSPGLEMKNTDNDADTSLKMIEIDDELDDLDNEMDLDLDWNEDGFIDQMGMETETHDSSLSPSHTFTSTEGNAPSLSKHLYDSNLKSPVRAIPKALDENFVSDFYRNSRLHHLSMWKAELRKFTNQIHANKKLSKDERTPSHPVYFHIDLDSFFVSATLKKRPELKGLPIAVCHGGQKEGNSTSSKGSYAEVASVSYEARAFGLRNGMFLGEAKQLCPDLICVPYEFEIYHSVSETFYGIMTSLTQNIEAVSCDEAYLEVSCLLTQGKSAMEIAQDLRQEIAQKTGCTASIGIGCNLLLARMATRVAKPNGQHEVINDGVKEFIGSQRVKDLPGVGWVLAKKLASMHIETCKQLQSFPLAKLQQEFGPKTGSSLYKYCRGEDDRTLTADRQRKSVSADINYGIRFTEEQEPKQFILNLASEVSRRLVALGLKGSTVTIKIMVRKKDSHKSKKYMGHGPCDNMARSTTLKPPTNSAEKIGKACVQLSESMGLAPDVYRGIGIQVTKLIDEADSTDQGISLLKFTKPIDANQALQNETVSPKKTTHNSNIQSMSETSRKNKRLSPSNRKVSGKRKVTNDRRISGFIVKRSSDQQAMAVDGSVGNKDPPLPSLSFSPPKNRVTAISLDLPSATSIDPSVFYALPKEMQASIKASYAAKDEIFNLSGSDQQNRNEEIPIAPATTTDNRPEQNVGYDDIDKEVWDELPSQIKNEILESRKGDQADSTGSIVVSTNKNHNALDTGPSTSVTKVIEDQPPNPHLTTKAAAPENEAIFSPSQIDQDVLKQLPPELRREVEMSAAMSRLRERKKIERKCEEKLITEMIHDKCVSKTCTEKTLPTNWPNSKGRPDLNGSVTFDDVKSQLKAWLASQEEPLPEDIDMVCSYFLALYNDHNLEQLDDLLKLFKRNASRCGIEWKNCFNTCLEFVQCFLIERMNAKLPIEKL